MKWSLGLLVGVVLAVQGQAEPIREVRVPGAVLDTVIARKTYHLSARELAGEVDRLLSTMKMKLNNKGTQSSFIGVGGFTIPFQIQRVTVDIDACGICPDLGDGLFYVNDVNLERADFRARSGYFELAMEFEDAGREIKGYHSVSQLGDNGMPDFEMNRPALTVRAMPVLSMGKMALAFSAANLSADIQSTGGCNIGGIDVCNMIFGTNRKIEKGVEAAAQGALNSALVQTALKQAISQYLAGRNITGTLRNVALVGDDLQVTIQ